MSSFSKVEGEAVGIVVPTGNPQMPFELKEKEIEAIFTAKDVVGKKIVLISIAGAYRREKSFFLNLCIACLEGKQRYDWLSEQTPMNRFHYRGGCEPDTNGIVIWNKPYFLEGRDGEEYAVFLMDTQGAFFFSFDPNSTIKDCVTIFGMSTLLSSVQIFNLSGGINSNDLNNLCLLTEYARLVKSNTAPFQKLLFLIRDWSYPGDYPYGLLGGKRYLKERVLSVTADQPRENQEVRRELAKIFEKLEACLLPHPGNQVAVDNSKEYLGEIDEDFRSEVLSLMSDLFKQENLLCKKINGKEITGGEFCHLFKAYMKSFNSGKLPEPKTIVEATAEAVMSGALEAAKKVYEQKMTEAIEKNMGLGDLLKLKALHNSAEAAGWRRFEERPKIGKDNGQKGQQCLREYCESRYTDFERIVEKNKDLAEKNRKLVDGLENVGRGKILSVGKGVAKGLGSVGTGAVGGAEKFVRGAGDLANW